ncbi:Multicopper oxidase mco [Pseudobythopirellula maris]|uniref:Multicopper oxidase mco n=1 Tax=Pseudobythopirellula maris TaxID=2527991 RepID=A0A5C5ZIR3_9BACT|nr:copper oxidase [Pseudobythopirellula maris]TWT86701.1 Multicopper oxidase mco [Pseudobythopirellula maris]
MSIPQEPSRPPRREFLRTTALAAGGALTGSSIAAAQHSGHAMDGGGRGMKGHNGMSPELPKPIGDPSLGRPTGVQDEYDGFRRFAPSRGNSPDSDYYLGKLVPGLRDPSAGRAPFVAPDITSLPYEMKGGVKEFHLRATPVEAEFLPGYKMNVYGYNGSMPGPTIEVTQGDRVRIVAKNELPEPTSMHWHGFELPVQWDGASELTQNLIEPGETFVYEFDIHEEGTFFYHSHIPMQEAFGMVGWFIVHPKKDWDPPVDRDFGLIFQNFAIEPGQTVSDSWAMDWSWHTINGRSGPFNSPLVVKHGERVRIRILNFSPMQHHPIHLHGHTFWVTGHEGARIPKSAWIPRNTELIAVAQASDFEFIANNPGDWMMHCHMVHHMMNHMTEQVGPRVRPHQSVDAYLANLDRSPGVSSQNSDPGFAVPGYPQKMKGMSMDMMMSDRIVGRRETLGMRADWPMAIMGLMLAVRVLPEDLYHLVMETDEPVEPGSVFTEIVRRFGDPSVYHPAMKMSHG